MRVTHWFCGMACRPWRVPRTAAAAIAFVAALIAAIPPVVAQTCAAGDPASGYPAVSQNSGGNSLSRSLTPATPPSGLPRTDGDHRFLPDEVVIEVDGAPSQADVDALAERHHLSLVESCARPHTTLYRWRIPDGRPIADVVHELEADRAVRSAQPNYVFTTQDQLSGLGAAQYAIVKLHVLQAQQLTHGDGIRVAIIDSGIDAAHPELAGEIEASFDALGDGTRADQHGTAVAGLVVAHIRLTGVSPGARILAVRSFSVSASGDSTTGTTFSIVKGLDWAMERHAQVINMSFAGPADPVTAQTLAEAARAGIVLIAAAGNAGPGSPPLFPADDPNVIAVAATDESDRLFKFSTPGPHIAVAAPGVDMIVAAPNGRYDIMSGTSLAAPLVSGVVALMLGRNPTLDPKSVRSILMATARDLGPAGRDDLYGAGLVDAARAVEAADAKSANPKTTDPKTSDPKATDPKTSDPRAGGGATKPTARR
jgi:subtilisin family serine protease